jgi:hypothetical protein
MEIHILSGIKFMTSAHKSKLHDSLGLAAMKGMHQKKKKEKKKEKEKSSKKERKE